MVFRPVNISDNYFARSSGVNTFKPASPQQNNPFSNAVEKQTSSVYSFNTQTASPVDTYMREMRKALGKEASAQISGADVARYAELLTRNKEVVENTLNFSRHGSFSAQAQEFQRQKGYLEERLGWIQQSFPEYTPAVHSANEDSSSQTFLGLDLGKLFAWVS